MVLSEGEERDADQPNTASICHWEGNSLNFTLMTLLKDSYDFSHFTED